MHSVVRFTADTLSYSSNALLLGGNNKLDIVNCPAVMMCSMVLQKDTMVASENTVQLWEYDT